jgi:hypothetical protein
MGWKTISVILLDVDDEEALRILLADNTTADKGTYDNPQLNEILVELKPLGLEGTGYTEGEARALGDRLANVEFLDDVIARPTGEDDDVEVTTTDKPGLYRLAYVVTAPQRDRVTEALTAAKAEFGVNTSAEALDAVCRQYHDKERE